MTRNQTINCMRCGYSLRGSPDRCPECGLTESAARTIRASRGPARATLLAVAVWLNPLLVSAVTMVLLRRDPDLVMSLGYLLIAGILWPFLFLYLVLLAHLADIPLAWRTIISTSLAVITAEIMVLLSFVAALLTLI